MTGEERAGGEGFEVQGGEEPGRGGGTGGGGGGGGGADSRKRHDPWAHRRGEPRVFAFFWTLFLFTVTLLGFLRLGVGGVMSQEVYRPVVRVMLVTIAVGVVVLWPMVRLSQAAPRRAWRASAQDWLIVVLPVQAVVWPQVFLARWSVMSVAGVSLLLASWGALVGGILAVVLGRAWSAGHDPFRGPSDAGPGWAARSGAAAVCVALTVLAPAIGVLTRVPWGGAAESVRVVWVLSPVTGVFELTRDHPWSPRPPGMGLWGWAGAALPGMIGVCLWAFSALRARGRGRMLKDPTTPVGAGGRRPWT